MPASAATPDSAPASHPALREVIDHEQRARRRRIAIRIAIAAVVCVAIAAAVVLLRPRPLPLAGRFRTDTVGRGPVLREVSATGRVEARTTVQVGAQISGRLASVDVDFNDAVTRGQVLARFDTESLDAQVAQSRASVKAAQAALEQAKVEHARAKRQLTRSQGLFDHSIESAEVLENLRSTAATADAAIKSAAAQLELQRANARIVETSHRYAEVTSPIDGVVISRNVEAGQTVAAAFQTPVLFTIAEDLVAMRVVAAIDEADMGEVEPGERASFTVDAFPQRTFDAVVTEVRSAAKVVQNVVTYEAVLDVENPERLLRPGMTASVKVRTAAVEDALHVPNAALRFTPPEQQAAKQTVWVLRDDALVAVRVIPGISNGMNTQIDDDGALQSGDLVLVDLTPAGRTAYGEK
jgi:HlyD family secretion protein